MDWQNDGWDIVGPIYDPKVTGYMGGCVGSFTGGSHVDCACGMDLLGHL